MSIEVRQLLKIYDEQKAVNNISFSVNKGEIVGFLGPNGAGKSTTMKIVTGYLRPTSGQALVCGINVAEQPLGVKKKIGYLPELNALYYDMYVREYLGFIASVHRLRDKTNKTDQVIELTGLKPESRKRIGQLSKGYKQRVGLAAALIHDPEVLILDEPTSGLDPNQIIEIREVIRQQGQDKTVLFSSHILQEVEAICDRVIIINKGVIVADDRLGRLRQASQAEHAVLVRFSLPTGMAWLENLAGVKKAVQSPDGYYKLTTDNPEAVKKELLASAVQQNLDIVSLQTESRSLESIFKSLTN